MQKKAQLSVLLVPGMMCTAELWQAQAANLADIAEVTIVDATREDDIAAMAHRILTHAPERFALAGLSMGGYVSFEVLRQQPHRVERLALLDTTARPDLGFQRILRQCLIALADAGRYSFVVDTLLPVLVNTESLGDVRLVGQVRRMAHEAGGDGARTFARQQSAILKRPDSRPLLPKIACPTLVLCGREDQFTPVEHHLEMAGLIPGAALAIVDRCGHLSTLEQPEQVSAALRRWLLS